MEKQKLIKRVKILPLEVIVRNISAGSFAKRYGVEEGISFETPTIEFSYKNDGLGDPLLNAYHPDTLLNICSDCFPPTLITRHGVSYGFHLQKPMLFFV